MLPLKVCGLEGWFLLALPFPTRAGGVPPIQENILQLRLLGQSFPLLPLNPSFEGVCTEDQSNLKAFLNASKVTPHYRLGMKSPPRTHGLEQWLLIWWHWFWKTRAFWRQSLVGRHGAMSDSSPTSRLPDWGYYITSHSTILPRGSDSPPSASNSAPSWSFWSQR